MGKLWLPQLWLGLSNFLESWVLEFWKFWKASFGKFPNAKPFNRLYLLNIGFDFGMLHTHAKEVSVSNQTTLRNFVWNLVLKSSEQDKSWFSHSWTCNIIISMPRWRNYPSPVRQLRQISGSKNSPPKKKKEDNAVLVRSQRPRRWKQGNKAHWNAGSMVNTMR